MNQKYLITKVMYSWIYLLIELNNSISCILNTLSKWSFKAFNSKNIDIEIVKTLID